MPQLINWDLIRQPYNWVIVFIMCSMALIFLTLVFPEPVSQGPNASDT
jgi:hypothetical protein